MTEDLIEYQKLVKRAMVGIVREALEMVVEKGLPGVHNFYITFETQKPGVQIADHLVIKFPTDMTIVLEHQFWNLEVSKEKFSVTLSFGGNRETLVVPFSSIISFVDPSVNFVLQLGDKTHDQSNKPDIREKNFQEKTQKNPEERYKKAATNNAQIVALDSFRKKKT